MKKEALRRQDAIIGSHRQKADIPLFALFGSAGSTMGTLGVSTSDAAVGQWGGGLVMFTQILCWTALLIGLSQLAMAFMARSRSRLETVREGALFLTAAAVAVLTFLDSGPRTVYEALRFPLYLTVLTGLGTMVTSGIRTRALARRLQVPSEETTSLWESVARALTESPTLDRMLLSVASAVRHTTRATGAVVYKLTGNGADPILVGSTSDNFSTVDETVTDGDLASLAAHAVGDSRVAEYHHAGFRPDPYARAGNWGVIPIAVGEETLGAVLLQEPGIAMTENGPSATFGTVGQLTGRAVKDWVSTARGTVSESLMDRLPRLATTLARETRFEKGLVGVEEAIRGMVDAEYIAIAWMDRAQSHEDRAAMIVGDTKIRDNRRRWPIWDGPTAHVLHTDRPLITPDLHEIDLQDYHDSAPVERRLGYRSRMIVPVRDAEGLIGSICIAHSEPSHYGEEDAQVMRGVAGVYGAWLRRLEDRRRSERYVETMRMASRLEEDPGHWASDRLLLEAVLPSVNTTGLTLWRIDPIEHTMHQVAQIGRVDDLAGEDEEHLPIAHTPWHRWAMTDQTPRFVNQSDPELLMSQLEAGKTMGMRVKTGWIVPVVWGTQTLGFLDATETRSPDRNCVGESEKFLLTVTARAFAQRWMTHHSDTAPYDWHYRVSSLSGSLINPLTGIYGAVDLIRHKQDNLTPDALKYLNLIEQAARRIHTSVTSALGTPEAVPAIPAEAAEEPHPRLALGSTPETAAPMERVRLGLKNRFATAPVGSMEMPG